MTATHSGDGTTKQGVLYLAFELGWNEWKLAFTTGHGQKPRFRSMSAEDGRQLHRELESLKGERTEHVNRIKGLLASQGVALTKVDKNFPQALATARLWDGSAVPPELHRRLLREYERWQLVDRQIRDLESTRRQRIRADDTPHVDQVRRLLELRGVGLNGAWLLEHELFGWRHFSNRRQVGGSAGLA